MAGTLGLLTNSARLRTRTLKTTSLAKLAPLVLDVVKRGYHVVSTCEELAWPWTRSDIANSIDAAARANNVAVLGTAILLGISERFLLRLEKQAEAVIDPDRAGQSDQTAPANTSAAVQRGQCWTALVRPSTRPLCGRLRMTGLFPCHQNSSSC